MRPVLCALLFLATFCLSLPTNKKHNILFLMCDSMDGRVLDPSSPVSQRMAMPNLRQLASEGTNFVRTYAESPQCVPSRASMFTGRYTHEIKAWSNEQGIAVIPSTGEVDPTCKKFYGEKLCRQWGKEQNVSATLFDSMKDNGYFMHLYGKVDVGAGLLGSENPSQANATANGFHSGPSIGICTRSADIRRPTKPAPLDITDDTQNNVHPEDWRMVDRCVEFLKNQDTAGWMLYCSVNIPHPAFNTNATWLAHVNTSAIPRPPWQDEDAMHPADSYMSQSKNVWGHGYSDQDVQKVRKTYYAMCVETDFLMGRVLRALKATGQYDDTYIIFLSDHGEMNMEHRQVWKNSMYEASERVPMMISGPGLQKGVTETRLTSLLDVYPTLVALAGGTPPSFLRGHSLLPLLQAGSSAEGTTFPEDRHVTAQYHSNMGNTGSFMVRWRQYKYIVFGTTLSTFKGYKAQLFDVDQDPDEMHDIAASNPDLVAAMEAKLKSHYDYQAVDKECKANDFMIYKNYFMDQLGRHKLRSKFQRTYKGFDDNDMQKIDAWVREATDEFK